MSNAQDLWNLYRQHLYRDRATSFALDLSRVGFPEGYVDQHRDALGKAFAAMADLEKGAIANPDEERMVGHYWLRNPDLAPSHEITDEIVVTKRRIGQFVKDVHSGDISGAGGQFENFLLVGIGGSALGPQFVANALGGTADKLKPYYFDNTDPDGMERTLAHLENALGRTLVIVVSKSGGTPETRNGMLEAHAAYKKAGLDFSRHAIAVTQEGSKLDKLAVDENWIDRFPMTDWVGGRTSVMSAVGLLPMGLQGIDVDLFLHGAADMDALTRLDTYENNPAARLALAWYFMGNGKGEKDMVLLPYKDSLMLFSRYLQQLVMESLGKEFDRQGNTVNQGIAVYGNKGSTDQHAYVQQLRDGISNFFVTFIEVLKDRDGTPLEVEPGITSGDYLAGLLRGTRKALFEKDRPSITITIDEVNPHRVGMLIALYERAVGLYGELVNVNAYHQPGVEAGKKAAAAVLELQNKLMAWFQQNPNAETNAPALANTLGQPDAVESIFHILNHLAANPERGIAKVDADDPIEVQFVYKQA